MNPLFAALLHAAVALTAHPNPGTLPEITPVTTQALDTLMCRTAPEPCRTPMAVYFKGAIFYDDRLDLERVYSQSVIVHELVHYVQETDGWPPLRQ